MLAETFPKLGAWTNQSGMSVCSVAVLSQRVRASTRTGQVENAPPDRKSGRKRPLPWNFQSVDLTDRECDVCGDIELVDHDPDDHWLGYFP